MHRHAISARLQQVSWAATLFSEVTDFELPGLDKSTQLFWPKYKVIKSQW
jgi:hypothetical protein